MGCEGIQVFLHDWVFPQVSLTGDTTMWFVASKEKRITAFNSLKYFHFKYVKGEDIIFRDLCNREKHTKRTEKNDIHMEVIWEVEQSAFGENIQCY